MTPLAEAPSRNGPDLCTDVRWETITSRGMVRCIVLVRAWHAAVAMLVVTFLAVQIGIAVHVPGFPPNVEPGVLRGASLGGRIVRVFSFFTIESNMLCGVVSALLATKPDGDSPVFRILRLDALFGITVTGIVYATVLAPIHEPKGWAEISSNTVFHYVVPIMTVVGWLLFGPRPRITAGVVYRSLLWPVAWLGYTLVRGAVWNWYPYPFLDVPTHGYGTVAVNCVGVTVVLAGVAALFAWGDGRLPRAPARRAESAEVVAW